MAISTTAIAENLQSRFKIRGGPSWIGIPIGIGIGVGTYIYENYDLTSPFSDMLQPSRPNTRPGGAFLGVSQAQKQSGKYGSQYKTLRSKKSRKCNRRKCLCINCC